MPYKNKRPGGMRRNGYKPKGKGAVSNAVKKYVRKVASKTRPEMKNNRSTFVESTLLNTAAVATSFLWSEQMGGIAQGPERFNRIGNEIYLHGHHSKGSYNNNGTVPVYVRRLILGYTTGISTGTGSVELFDTTDGTGSTITATGNTMGLITQPINKNQFKVYSDKTIKLSPSTATDGTQTKMYNYFQKFGGKKVKFEGNTNGLLGANWRFAEVWLVAQADNDSAAGSIVEQSGSRATYFTDP